MPRNSSADDPQRPARRYAQESDPRPPAQDPALLRAALLGARLRKLWRDLGAVLLLAAAVLTLFGLLGLSSGTLLDAWASFLQQWFGWGAVLVPLTIGWLAWVQLVTHVRTPGAPLPIRWGRVIWAETAGIALLGLLNLTIGASAAEAASGHGGGLVGWGIGYLFTRLLPPPTDGLVLLAIFLLGLFLATDVTADRLGRLLDWLQGLGFEAERPAGGPADPASARRAARPAPRTAAPIDEPVTTRDVLPGRKAPAALAPDERVHVTVKKANAPARPTRFKPQPRAATLPGLDLLDSGEQRKLDKKSIDETASIIVKTLKEFGVPVTMGDEAQVGPSVTQYHVYPGVVDRPGPDGLSKQWKVRVAQISSLADDLALALSANTIRIEAPVPGKNFVGIEVPHRRSSTVGLRPVLESETFQKINSPLAIALGRNVAGEPMAADLVKMPHLLIAGTTGSGKSVMISAIVTCLVTNNTPDDLWLVLIDPKMVELVRFNGLPHLYGNVETDLDRITGVLRWVTKEMDRRYKLFETVHARNLDTYRSKTAKKANAERLPYLVVLIDELADLMMRAPDETERTVVRLAQMARATGIHMVVATQRPSTDIVTGLIKANFPARISFAVTSLIDSRVILDSPGAESLLGRGDMLFLTPEAAAPVRVQGCLVSDREIDRVVKFWKEQAAENAPDEAEVDVLAAEPVADPDASPDELPPGQAPWEAMLAREAVVEDKDGQIEQAIAIVKKYGTASASLLQRKMRLGYPRAARLMDELREMGIVGREQSGGKTREVFVRGADDPIGDRAARLMAGPQDDGGAELDDDGSADEDDA